jgi:hypothetical protein
MAELLTIPQRELKQFADDYDSPTTGLATEHVRNHGVPLQPARGGPAASSPVTGFGHVMHALIVVPPLVAGLVLMLFGLLPAVFIALILLLLGITPMLLVALGIMLTEGVKFTEDDLMRRRLSRKLLQHTATGYDGGDPEDLHLVPNSGKE